jgi:hypothetical protein
MKAEFKMGAWESRTYKKLAETFKAADYNDDRRVFLNIYNLIIDVESEKPKTPAGELALRMYHTKMVMEIDRLYWSLDKRNMLK